MRTQIYSTTVLGKFCLNSADEKPTDCPNGSLIYEINTGKAYSFDAENMQWDEIPMTLFLELWSV